MFVVPMLFPWAQLVAEADWSLDRFRLSTSSIVTMSDHGDKGNDLSDLLSCSDTNSVRSDDTEPDPPSSDTDDSNPPGTPIETRHPTRVTIQSPGQSFSEKDRITMPRSMLQGEGSARGSLEYDTVPEKTIMSASIGVPNGPAASWNLPPQFLEWLREKAGVGGDDYEVVCKYLGEVWRLQLQWDQAGRDGFMTQVRIPVIL